MIKTLLLMTLIMITRGENLIEMWWKIVLAVWPFFEDTFENTQWKKVEQMLPILWWKIISLWDFHVVPGNLSGIRQPFSLMLDCHLIIIMIIIILPNILSGISFYPSLFTHLPDVGLSSHSYQGSVDSLFFILPNYPPPDHNLWAKF